MPRDLHEKSVKKNPALFTFWPILALEALLLYIYIGHYFLPIDYVIFILTQRLVPVAHVLFTLLFECSGVRHILCCVFLRAYPVLSVSLDCPILIAPSVLSGVYFNIYKTFCDFESHSWRFVLDTTLCDKVCQRHATGRWFSPGTPISPINKTDRHDKTEILLK